jgi:hypothetical protein
MFPGTMGIGQMWQFLPRILGPRIVDAARSGKSASSPCWGWTKITPPPQMTTQAVRPALYGPTICAIYTHYSVLTGYNDIGAAAIPLILFEHQKFRCILLLTGTLGLKVTGYRLNN